MAKIPLAADLSVLTSHWVGLSGCWLQGVGGALGFVGAGPGLSKPGNFLPGGRAWETGVNTGANQEAGSRLETVSAP